MEEKVYKTQKKKMKRLKEKDKKKCSISSHLSLLTVFFLFLI